VFVRTRQARVALAQPIAVAPRSRVSAVPVRSVPPAYEAPAGHRPATGGTDIVRTVRPYVAGDPARLVHWPTSARMGDLVVREHDPPDDEGVALLVDLTGRPRAPRSDGRDEPADRGEPDRAAETAAEIAMGVGRAVLARGGRLFLGTCTTRGPVGAPVADVRELGRRLAYAVPGPPAGAPHGWPVHHVTAAGAERERARR
jgi:uncharacterized protein (DUF58 family)